MFVFERCALNEREAVRLQCKQTLQNDGDKKYQTARWMGGFNLTSLLLVISSLVSRLNELEKPKKVKKIQDYNFRPL